MLELVASRAQAKLKPTNMRKIVVVEGSGRVVLPLLSEKAKASA